MSMENSWWQYAAVALAVLASTIQVARKIAPRFMATGQRKLANACGRPGRPPWLRRLGQWLDVPVAAPHCNDGCSVCGACDNGSAGTRTEAPISMPPSRVRTEFSRQDGPGKRREGKE